MKSNQQLVGLAFMVIGILVAVVFAKTFAGLVGFVNGHGWLTIYDRPLLGPDFTVSSTAGVLLAAGLAFFAWTRPDVQVAANETAGELRKVTWPQFTPLFSMETEVWVGAVVVLVSTIVMSLILFGLDSMWSRLTGLIY